MDNARRIYTYVVSAISLVVLFSAVMSLLRIVVNPMVRANDDVALQLAILLVATPMYLGHWLWQQRLAAADPDEASNLFRVFYFYVILALMVGIALVDGYEMIASPLGYGSGSLRGTLAARMSRFDMVTYYGIPVAMAACVWSYHWDQLQPALRKSSESEGAAILWRCYAYGYAAVGLSVVSFAGVELMRWLMSQVGSLTVGATPLDVEPVPAALRLIIGLVTWLIFWMWVQGRYRKDQHERQSVLRRFYLYLIVFAGTAGVAGTLTVLLASTLRGFLGLEVHDDIRNPLAVIIVSALLWGLHLLVLREDGSNAGHTEQQAEMRRLYLCLTAAVGMMTLLAGTIGEISTLLVVLDEGMHDIQRELIAYFTAAIIAGLPIWLIAWRKIQTEVEAAGDADAPARHSDARRFYLYFFLLVTIIGVLGGAIFVLYRLLEWTLVGRGLDLTEMATAIAAGVVCGLVWIYHWSVLRRDRAVAGGGRLEALEALNVLLLDDGTGSVYATLAGQLQQRFTNMKVRIAPIGAGEGAVEADPATYLADADIVVMPWTHLLAPDQTVAGGADLRTALGANPAQKLLLPAARPGWHWIDGGGDSESRRLTAVVQALEQIALGDTVAPRRRLGCVGILIIIFVLTVVLPSVASIVFNLLLSGL